MPIKSCKDRRTRRFLAGERVKEFEQIARAAAKALTRLQAAVMLVDLRQPPSNRFAALENEPGVYSIRINKQYRVCFKWQPHGEPPEGTDPLLVEGDPYDVEINNHYGD
jgi:proteic killer suppression protein